MTEIPNMFPHLTALEAGACRTALKRMLDTTRYFDITAFKNLCEVAKCVPESRDSSALRLLHCVDWKDMDRETRQEARKAILRTFRMPEDMTSAFLEAYEDPKPRNVTLFKRLLGVAS